MLTALMLLSFMWASSFLMQQFVLNLLDEGEKHLHFLVPTHSFSSSVERTTHVIN